jgi:C-1 hydroxylase
MPAREEQNKEIFHAFVRAWNARDFTTMMACWSPDLVHHHRTGDYGRDDVFPLMNMFMQAFPDLRFEVLNLVAEGDFVSARMRARATHQHEFAGVPATGRDVTVTVMGLVKIVDGKIAEHWNVMDELYLVQQLGLVPAEFLEALAPS